MWFALGSISLIGCIFFFVRWRSASRWLGTQAQCGRLPYEYCLQKHKSKIVKVIIGVSCDTPFEFCLKPENVIDRIFKWLGLSLEQQINHLHFDEKVYIVSDDARLGVLLKYSKTLPILLESLFAEQRFTLGRVRKLWCQNGRVWVECKPAKGFDDGDEVLLAKEVLPDLNIVRDALLERPNTSSESRDHFIARAAILVGFSTALAVNGAVQVFRTLFGKFPAMMDRAGLWQTAGLVGGSVAIGLIILCVFWLGRTSRAHLVLIELLLVGTAGCVLTATTELRDYNIEFDQSAVRNESVKVDRFYTTRCGKRNSSTCYHVRLAPFPGKPDGVELNLSSDTYYRLHNHSHLVLPVHAGALGWRWVDEPQAPSP